MHYAICWLEGYCFFLFFFLDEIVLAIKYNYHILPAEATFMNECIFKHFKIY